MSKLSIIEAECLDGGVLITFDDGMTALFSASFMADHLPDALETHQVDAL